MTMLLVFIGLSTKGYAASYTSTNFSSVDPAITAGFGSAASSNFGLGQSFGQSVVGRSISATFQVWSGFQYFKTASAFVATGTAGNTQATISWTAPHLYLGATVGSYELGVGTVSGSYTFENIGTVSTFTKTGLTNGVQYYFIVKAKSPAGEVLSFSNEVTVLPITAIIQGGGGGGGGGGSNGGGSGNASLVIKGLAYPGAQVTILRDGVVAAVTTADQGALFSITLNNLVASHYTIGVYGQDSGGRKSTSYSFPVTLTDSVTAEITNVFLAPTIGVDSSTVKKGDPIGIFGTAAPNAQVDIYVHSATELTEKVNSSSAGAWFKQFDTSFLELGDHITFSRQMKNSRITDTSASVGFIVGDKTVKADTTCKRSDLNCDGKVNITDLSMLLYYWHKTPPPTSRADINKSGTVDATDFSILLYDWTG